jgi:hypothetical protein
VSGNLLQKYAPAKPDESTGEEPVDSLDDLGAFAALRGIHDRALMLELRHKDGRRRALGYAWLHDVQFDPSNGITLYFGKTKVTIEGRNLNTEIRPGVRLFECIIRHRVPWVQEADEAAALLSSKEMVVIETIEIES